MVALVAKLQEAPRQPNVAILQRQFPIDGQRQLSRYVAESIGFDFNRGRLDETSHPFCTSLGPNDCRILSRYDQHWLPAGLYGTMHEAGHGMYDQGLRGDWHGLPPGSYASLGIHESQSRLWENQVGRSAAFWKWLLPKAKQLLGGSLADCSVDDVHFAVNAVQPSLIRVEADEQYLGIRSPSAADGVLQDVHWSAGLFGYFPTYTLGNLASAQLFQTAQSEVQELDSQLEQGEFGGLLGWLRANIHRHGRCYTGDELIENATKMPLSAKPLLDSLQKRYAQLFY